MSFGQFECSPQAEKRSPEFFQDSFPEFGTGFGNFRKIFHPLIRSACIDHSTRIQQRFRIRSTRSPDAALAESGFLDYVARHSEARDL
jgi:hypothetical protein